MKPRNFSPHQMFVKMAESHQPVYHFDASRSLFQAWKAEAKPRVLATLGDWPPTVDLNPELVLEWEDRKIRKRRYYIDVGPHISATVQVNLPSNLQEGEKRPAILCWHGHGSNGKEPVMGNPGEPCLHEEIRNCNYDYGLQMAGKGFVTYAIDWIGCGDRNDTLKPHQLSKAMGRDWCNLYYLHATMFGMTSLSINLTHGRLVTDFITTLPEVDANRLGVMGMSGGGTMTVWTALTDSRFKAAEIICYSDLWALFGIRDINYCGMQVAPGLYKLVDLPELQGLLAPLPLLIDIGAYDKCFSADNAFACFKKVKSIYKAAGSEDHLHLNLFPGGHMWSSTRSEEFFNEYLCVKSI